LKAFCVHTAWDLFRPVAGCVYIELKTASCHA